MLRKITLILLLIGLFTAGQPGGIQVASAKTAVDYSQVPPFVSAQVPPLVMLVMAKDHKLSFPAYNDATDLDGDGMLEVHFKPSITYSGYFDCWKCYNYSSGNQRFEIAGDVSDPNLKTCTGTMNANWSGNYLNYLAMSRMDVLRKVLYGGYRSTDTGTTTVLERAYIPQDAHAWGKEYKSVANDGFDIRDYTPLALPNSGNRHLFSCASLSTSGPPYLQYLLDRTERIWDWVARDGYQAQGLADSSVVKLVARVLVGTPSSQELKNYKQYPNGTYQPVGLLQKYGETQQMRFGLLTGSYRHNLQGGVLRKPIGNISDEINSNTGQILSNGIIDTINKFRIFGYNHSSHVYDNHCSANWNAPTSDGNCQNWGNPIGEMMYEALRYFAGETSATSAFDYGTTDYGDISLGLPKVTTWQDPYGLDLSGNPRNPACAIPIMLVISDIYTSYDSDQLPGSYFSGQAAAALGAGTLNVQTLANTISTDEAISGNPYFIGQAGATVDSSCAPKTVTGLGSTRGQCPEEPTKQGSYYAASLAYYGRTTDLNAATGDQKVYTYAVGLSSPMPDLKITVGTGQITIVPFAKSAVWSGTIDSSQGAFQPTNQLAGFFVNQITPTFGEFRINFEDAEQGNDYDKDAETTFRYEVVDNTGAPVSDPANGTKLKVTLISAAAAGGIQAHLGYIISGSTNDGTYIDVLDWDTTSGYSQYYLDTNRLRNASYGSSYRYENYSNIQSKIDNTIYSNDTRIGARDGNMSNTYNNDSKYVSVRSFTPRTTGGADLLTNPLWYAAKWGAFTNRGGDANKPDVSSEWDSDGDGVPDTYFYVQNPTNLEERMAKTFADILRRVSAGTAASVISSTRSGEGAVYQAVFYPEYRDSSGNGAAWVGEIHSLLVDAQGNMREDTNGNHQLDSEDETIVFSEANPGQVERQSTGELVPLEELHYLWSASSWLNEIADADILTQRSTYISAEKKRYIFTFNDANSNMVPDDQGDTTLTDIDTSGETVQFIPSLSAIYDYLKTPADTGTPDPQKVIKYTRGQDQTGFRSRQLDYDNDGTVETWRLGDIVYSTPTVVAAPAENYDQLYKDTSYIAFLNKYKTRRNVVYAGANDGMLHAFNGGFFNPAETKFYKTYDTTNGYTDGATSPDLGAELWAYVPYNLLPHLHWLTETTYGVDRTNNRIIHVPYVDHKPRIFDAKIFDVDDDHPNGWGTVMVIGMRFGGGRIWADTNGNDSQDTGERVMSSAFIVMDITNPEKHPRLLAEITSDSLGFTTCYPAVIVLKDKVPASDQNKWYLLLGSGPHGTNYADWDALTTATSNQPAKLVVVDLRELAKSTGNSLQSFNSSDTLAAGVNIFASLDTNSFVSDPIVVDYDLDYRADAVYFGTIANTTGWDGKLRRIVVDNKLTPNLWTKDSTLIDLASIHQPVSAPATVGIDQHGQRWVYFGTGRFIIRNDVVPPATQSFYGIKEPYHLDPLDDTVKIFDWTAVTPSDLLNVTNAVVHVGGSVTGLEGVGITDFATLENKIGSPDEAEYDGWYINFASQERNLGQAALLGQILTFTSYIPSADLCTFEGTSTLWAPYFATGTAYYSKILPGPGQVNQGSTVLRNTSLGKGLSVTPNIHTGREAGSKAFIQTSTGAIMVLEQSNPGATKSGKSSWREEEE